MSLHTIMGSNGIILPRYLPPVPMTSQNLEQVLTEGNDTNGIPITSGVDLDITAQLGLNLKSNIDSINLDTDDAMGRINLNANGVAGAVVTNSAGTVEVNSEDSVFIKSRAGAITIDAEANSLSLHAIEDDVAGVISATASEVILTATQSTVSLYAPTYVGAQSPDLKLVYPASNGVFQSKNNQSIMPYVYLTPFIRKHTIGALSLGIFSQTENIQLNPNWTALLQDGTNTDVILKVTVSLNLRSDAPTTSNVSCFLNYSGGPNGEIYTAARPWVLLPTTISPSYSTFTETFVDYVQSNTMALDLFTIQLNFSSLGGVTLDTTNFVMICVELALPD